MIFFAAELYFLSQKILHLLKNRMLVVNFSATRVSVAAISYSGRKAFSFSIHSLKWLILSWLINSLLGLWFQYQFNLVYITGSQAEDSPDADYIIFVNPVKLPGQAFRYPLMIPKLYDLLRCGYLPGNRFYFPNTGRLSFVLKTIYSSPLLRMMRLQFLFIAPSITRYKMPL